MNIFTNLCRGFLAVLTHVVWTIKLLENPLPERKCFTVPKFSLTNKKNTYVSFKIEDYFYYERIIVTHRKFGEEYKYFTILLDLFHYYLVMRLKSIISFCLYFVSYINRIIHPIL